jgi:hypothetical protein
MIEILHETLVRATRWIRYSQLLGHDEGGTCSLEGKPIPGIDMYDMGIGWGRNRTEQKRCELIVGWIPSDFSSYATTPKRLSQAACKHIGPAAPSNDRKPNLHSVIP